jgi:hypothetical protein
MSASGSVPIIGQQKRADFDEAMAAHLEGLVSMVETHKTAIRIGTMELNEYHATAESPNMIYMELLKTQIASHCASVTQATGMLALLSAIGINGVPLPAGAGPSVPEGEPIQ